MSLLVATRCSSRRASRSLAASAANTCSSLACASWARLSTRSPTRCMLEANGVVCELLRATVRWGLRGVGRRQRTPSGGRAQREEVQRARSPTAASPQQQLSCAPSPVLLHLSPQQPSSRMQMQAHAKLQRQCCSVASVAHCSARLAIAGALEVAPNKKNLPPPTSADAGERAHCVAAPITRWRSIQCSCLRPCACAAADRGHFFVLVARPQGGAIIRRYRCAGLWRATRPLPLARTGRRSSPGRARRWGAPLPSSSQHETSPGSLRPGRTRGETCALAARIGIPSSAAAPAYLIAGTDPRPAGGGPRRDGGQHARAEAGARQGRQQARGARGGQRCLLNRCLRGGGVSSPAPGRVSPAPAVRARFVLSLAPAAARRGRLRGGLRRGARAALEVRPGERRAQEAGGVPARQEPHAAHGARVPRRHLPGHAGE